MSSSGKAAAGSQTKKAAGLSDEDTAAMDRIELFWWQDYDKLVDEEARQAIAGRWWGKSTGSAGDFDKQIDLVILLDQFTRNIWRGQGEQFASDKDAQKIVLDAVAAGMDKELSPSRRWFLYMPLMHSEDIEHHRIGQELMDKAAEDSDDKLMKSSTKGFSGFFVRHTEKIRKFGRYPHRNKMLGRKSTPEEIAHLEQDGGF